MANSVTIYSNGVAAFRRTYPVTAGGICRITLPLKKDNVSDTLASFRAFGPVRVVEPLGYTPKKKEPNLTINSSCALSSLIQMATGFKATVRLNGSSTANTVVGRVLGYESRKTVMDQTVVEDGWMSLQLADGQIRNIGMNVIEGITFEDAFQGEVSKALDYRREAIKPDSTFVSIGLLASGPTEVEFFYKHQAPVWKPSYRCVLEDSGCRLLGFAVVDNDTDDDWTQCQVTVSTGQPITFNSHLNEPFTPARGEIRVGPDKVQGPVRPEAGPSRKAMRSGLTPMMASASTRGGGLESISLADEGTPYEPVSQMAVVTEEVGDASFFSTADGITIPAQKSALINIIETTLGEAAQVLYYKKSDNPKFGTQAIEGVNKSGKTLAHGPCSVENQGRFVGEAEMPLVKPGGSMMLAYEVNTTVKFTCRAERKQPRLSSTRLSGGILFKEDTVTCVSHYTINNSLGGDTRVVIDHIRELSNSTVTIKEVNQQATSPQEVGHLTPKDIGDLSRLTLTIPAGSEVCLSLEESRVDSSSVEQHGVLHWFVTNPKARLLGQPALAEVVATVRRIQETDTEIGNLNGQVAALNAEQERIRKNLEGLKGTTNYSVRQARLAASDESLSTLEQKTIPAAKKKRQELVQTLDEMLHRINVRSDE